METAKDGYVKSYQDESWLSEELKTKTVRQIAKEKHISYKLVNKYALTFGLIKNSPELQLP